MKNPILVQEPFLRNKDISSCRDYCSHYPKHYPHSYFQVKPRKKPEELAYRKRKCILQFTGSCERRLNCFDQTFIEICQYFNERAYSPHQHRVGLIFKFIASWILFFCSVEIACNVAVAFSILLWKNLARQASEGFFIVFFLGRGFNRFIYRSRPSQLTPPRAFEIQYSTGSSFIVIQIAFISVLAFDIIHGTHNISYNWLFVIVPVTFVVLSFCVMHLGLNNATDCLWTLVLTLVLIVITRYLPTELISLSRDRALMMTCIIVFSVAIIVAIINAHPIKFWRKSAYLLSVSTAIILFSITQDPLIPQNPDSQPALVVIAVFAILYNIGMGVIAGSFIGLRSGHCLTLSFRVFFFIVHTVVLLLLQFGAQSLAHSHLKF